MTINNLLLQHPIFTHAYDIAAICKPLQRFNITYFSHVKIRDGKLAALAIDPLYAETYFSNKFYNSHMGDDLGEHILWDALSFTGKTAEVRKESFQLGLCHSFTIVEKNKGGNDYFHFSCNTPNFLSINQFYISNIDMLKAFIEYFKDSVKQSNELLRAYDYQFNFNKTAKRFETTGDTELLDLLSNRALFLQDIAMQRADNKIVKSKDVNGITLQKAKCLSLLAKGLSAKEIARVLNLSSRTVDHYLQQLRYRFNCKNSKELISLYYQTTKT
ncbi:TPA: helix-turn-helix transcriptional regulator [Legionella pneumophila]|nr:helix-turn-helix transcriptional regulator [Legionella pneumophila]HAU0352113.1 helix-turn-helix transcriptional regulator [Legionella pneumophila]HAU0355289.1 helix-turn-helix transcriptional regulator [Legionella pneumophila]HAU0361458.1 helix-turn-helix transcriptional regulator [Legionella pneumophila]HAU0370233.1 helix-turn-helix transcriptional regulator [Legionella pneumophila]